MNRQTRRAAKAMARHTVKSKDHQIVAVHEAGHAVAKVMAAPRKRRRELDSHGDQLGF
jgi:phage-related protein